MASSERVADGLVPRLDTRIVRFLWARAEWTRPDLIKRDVIKVLQDEQGGKKPAPYFCITNYPRIKEVSAVASKRPEGGWDYAFDVEVIVPIFNLFCEWLKGDQSNNLTLIEINGPPSNAPDDAALLPSPALTNVPLSSSTVPSNAVDESPASRSRSLSIGSVEPTSLPQSPATRDDTLRFSETTSDDEFEDDDEEHTPIADNNDPASSSLPNPAVKEVTDPAQPASSSCNQTALETLALALPSTGHLPNDACTRRAKTRLLYAITDLVGNKTISSDRGASLIEEFGLVGSEYVLPDVRRFKLEAGTFRGASILLLDIFTEYIQVCAMTQETVDWSQKIIKLHDEFP